jgi:hypothetical protein
VEKEVIFWGYTDLFIGKFAEFFSAWYAAKSSLLGAA